MAAIKIAATRRIHFFIDANTVQWLLIGVLLFGSLFLWWGTLGSLLQTGGFDGMMSWQTMGIGLALFQSYKLTQVLAGRMPHQQKRRLQVIRAILNLNILANLVALSLIYIINPMLDRFIVAQQDIINFALFAIVFGGIFMSVGFQLQRLREPRPLFWLAVISRVIPQATLICTPQLAHMPATAIIGVLLIGMQRSIVMGWEYMLAYKRHNIAALRNLFWTLASDALNVAAAIIVLVGWLAVA